jgi:hypothetical protein
LKRNKDEQYKRVLSRIVSPCRINLRPDMQGVREKSPLGLRENCGNSTFLAEVI